MVFSGAHYLFTRIAYAFIPDCIALNIHSWNGKKSETKEFIHENLLFSFIYYLFALPWNKQCFRNLLYMYLFICVWEYMQNRGEWKFYTAFFYILIMNGESMWSQILANATVENCCCKIFSPVREKIYLIEKFAVWEIT